MLKRTLLFISLGSGLLIDAQTINDANAATKTSGKVGINTDIPTRTLTIKNSTANNGKPVLRLVDIPTYRSNVNSNMDPDLGGSTQSSANYLDYKPLVVDNVGDVYLGVPITNNTSFITLTISNVKGDWVEPFDTGIDYDKYAVTLMNYTFKLPTASPGKVTMLASEYSSPNRYGGVNKFFARIAPPTVKLSGTAGGNWKIEADYLNMGVEEFSSNNSTQGTTPNGTWILNLLVAPRDVINFTELEFNQGGSKTGVGRSDNTYKAKLDALLDKISHN